MFSDKALWKLWPAAAICLVLAFSLIVRAEMGPEDNRESFYRSKPLPSVASATELKPGDIAPDFALRDLAGNEVRLSQFRGKKNVVLSFIPAAWTPACSSQWPGYNVAKEFFDKSDAVLLGISVDNVPTLFAWTRQMGQLWFPVLSDFWPHGAVAKSYGILRKEGISERALFVIDKQGVIRYMDIHDINTIPRLEALVKQLENLPE